MTNYEYEFTMTLPTIGDYFQTRKFQLGFSDFEQKVTLARLFAVARISDAV